MKDFYSKDIVVPEEFRESFGDYTYGNPWISGHGSNYLKVGKFCSIADGCRFLLGADHNYYGLSTYPFENIRESDGSLVWNKNPDNKPEENNVKIGITIGNDVWLGYHVTVLNGVTIGDGAVIGAGAVVSKDIPPYSIAVGCPIQIIKHRFSPEQIKQLLEIQWWNRVDVLEVIQYLNDIDGFIEKYGK